MEELEENLRDIEREFHVFRRAATYLAYASIHEVDFLCTWNFRHLANAFALMRLRKFNEKLGIFVPHVCTPEELLGE